jgi:hypothetical protein
MDGLLVPVRKSRFKTFKGAFVENVCRFRKKATKEF